MRFVLRLALFVVLVAALVWFVQERRFRQGGTAAATLRDAGEALADLDLKLDLDGLRNELNRTGRIVRRKAAMAARTVAEATEDVRTTAAIKARLALDPQLSALDITVGTADGRVTLGGWVDSPEHLARLVRLALEHEGVVEVISTVRIRPTLAEGAATGR